MRIARTARLLYPAVKVVAKSGACPASPDYRSGALMLSYMAVVRADGITPPMLRRAARLQRAALFLCHARIGRWWRVRALLSPPCRCERRALLNELTPHGKVLDRRGVAPLARSLPVSIAATEHVGPKSGASGGIFALSPSLGRRALWRLSYRRMKVETGGIRARMTRMQTGCLARSATAQKMDARIRVSLMFTVLQTARWMLTQRALKVVPRAGWHTATCRLKGGYS